MNASRNAFTLNSLGVAHNPFPFVIKLSLTNMGTTALWICPVAVRDVSDTLLKAAQNYLFILDFAGVNLVQGTNSLHSLTELANVAGISFQSYESDVIAIPTPALPALLAGINHYEFRMIDLPRQPSQEEAYSLYAHFAQTGTDTPLGFATFELKSSFYLHSHDDCYTFVESLSPELSLLIVDKSLRTYVATIAADAGQNWEDISPLSQECLHALLSTNALTILRHHTGITNGIMQIGFARNAFDFRNSVDPGIDGKLSYDSDARTWTLKE